MLMYTKVKLEYADSTWLESNPDRFLFGMHVLLINSNCLQYYATCLKPGKGVDCDVSFTNTRPLGTFVFCSSTRF